MFFIGKLFAEANCVGKVVLLCNLCEGAVLYELVESLFYLILELCVALLEADTVLLGSNLVAKDCVLVSVLVYVVACYADIHTYSVNSACVEVHKSVVVVANLLKVGEGSSELLVSVCRVVACESLKMNSNNLAA